MGLPRTRSKALSTRSSKRAMRARTRSGTSGTNRRYSGGDGRQQFFGAGGVAAPCRAVLAERAPLAQPRRSRLEVLGLARPLDGLPNGGRPLLEASDRLLGWLGDDRHRLGQIEQLYAVGPAPEEALAQEGVEVHAAQPALLIARLGGAARFVIGDHQAAGVELEAVDDPPQAQGADLDFEPELEADGVDGGRVLEEEVVAQQRLGLGEERGLLVGREAETRIVGVLPQLGLSAVEAFDRGGNRALAGPEAEQQLEGPMDERALGGVGRGWLGQAVDGREPKGQGAV